MKKIQLYSCVCLLSLSSVAFAEKTKTNVPDSSTFVGMGGSYNSINVNQEVSGYGVSNVSNSAGTLLAHGTAGGPASSFNDTKTTFAPSLQLGYFEHFKDNYLWGAKLSYKYLDHTTSNQKVDVPQYGAFTSLNGTETFTGNAIVGSVQTITKHQVDLMPFVGKSFENSYVYFGAGPSLINVQTKANNIYCFANIDSKPTDIAGTPLNFSKTQWVWGGTAQLGATYFIDSIWAADFNYSYTLSQRYASNFVETFSNAASRNDTTNGTAYANTSERFSSQGVMISINSHF